MTSKIKTKEEIFFYNLLDETKQDFLKSPVKEKQEELGKNWNYAICETPIQKNKGIIFGLNWGGDNHQPQSDFPVAEKERNWNFMNNSLHYFDKYLKIKSISEVNYSNLCFFRSPKIHYLNWKDWELAIPLFRRYVDYINPPWALLLGKTGIGILDYYGHLKNLKKIEIKGKRKRTFGYSGILFEKYPFYCVPHPQAHIATDVREKVWKNVIVN